MIKISYPLENVPTPSSEPLRCIMQIIKRTSKKKKKKKKKEKTPKNKKRLSFKFIFPVTIRKIYSNTWKKSLVDIRHF